MNETSSRLSHRQLLRRLMRHAASAGSLDAVYQAALDCVQHGLGIDCASLLLFDDAGTMQFVAWSCLSEDYRRAVTGHSPWSPAESEAAPILVSDVEADPSMAVFAPCLRREGIRALAFIPLQVGRTLLGKFMLYYREPHSFSVEEIAAAEQIADYVVFALEHHRIAVALEEQLISERELRRLAADAAREADRRKDDFLATLAHELRNPLAAVRIGVAVIEKSNGDSATVVEYCTVMERQLRHLTRLVDDLLDVADITRRGLPLEKSRIELSAVVRVAVETCRALAEQADHDLTVALPTEPIMLDADPARLVQVLTNLLSNAVKYTPHGGRIQLAVERDAEEARISVTDTGLGIPPDKIDSVFEMFSQLDRSLETGHKGLGIGLSLASALVSRHGGRITARSDGVGAGSEFSVWLPIAAASGEALPVPPIEAPRDARDAARCRVLVVDDNADVTWSTSRLLREFGHDVRIALDGADAMEIAEQYRPDVVLLDIGMPKMNGYEVARRLRSTSWGRAMTLVAVTGWGQDSDQRRSADAGFDRHMTKPVDPLALEAFLDSFARAQTAGPRLVANQTDGARVRAGC